jgi:PKD repeat protein
VGGGCRFTDGSSDSDGEIEAWSWDFGDGSTSADRNPAHTYREAGTYQVELAVTDDDGSRRTFSSTVSVTPSSRVPRPTIRLSECTAGQACRLSGGTESGGNDDGDEGEDEEEITSWSWSFGDGGTSTERNPVHTFAVANNYTITLSVTDETGATGSVTAQLTVAPVTPSESQPIALTGSLRVQQGRHLVRLTWTGAAGAVLDLYRNNQWRERTSNDGLYIRPVAGPGTSLVYRVCERGTARCSNDVTVTIGGSRISLTATGSVRNGREEATLRWSGTGSSSVDVYRNTVRITRTNNDGLYVSSRARTGGASTATFRVCERGTSICSNTTSITFR